jgi:hypothetical protein
VTVHTATGEHAVTLRGGPDAHRTLGYRATAEAFLAMARGAPSPVPWEQTRAILTVLTEARAGGEAPSPVSSADAGPG